MYETLDQNIIKAIELTKNPIYEKACVSEAKRIGAETGREDFRVIDGRLQALRKRGVLEYITKKSGAKKCGWKVVAASS